MRIGIYAPNLTTPGPSGVERYASELVKALAALSPAHEVVLFTDAEALPLAPGWRRVALPPMGWARRLRTDHVVLPRLAREERLDVLHCAKSGVPAGLDCASVMTVFDVIFLKHPSLYPRWWLWYWRRTIRRSVERASAIATISATTARDLEECVPAASGKVHPIPIGVDPRFFSRPPAQSGEGREGTAGRYFLFVGNITARKNIPLLIDAYLRAGKGLGASLVLAGSVDYRSREALEALSRGERDGGVRYVSRVSDDELAALYRGALALVYPSRYEGFGLPALEAMASGCPVIASNAGALPEVAGDAAVLVDPDSLDGLAEAMRRMAGDAGLRGDLAARGLARAREFSWERTAARTLEVYERAGGRVAEAVR